MSEVAENVHVSPEVAAQLEVEKLSKAVASGANWFYWIAGLSLVNSMIFLLGGKWSFIIGLGVTQVVDAVAIATTEQGGGVAVVVRAFAFGFDLLAAAVVVLFGWLSGKKKGWAFIVGMTLYLLDGLLFLVFKDWPSVAFHVFALVCIFSGYRALRSLGAVQVREGVIAIEPGHSISSPTPGLPDA